MHMHILPVTAGVNMCTKCVCVCAHLFVCVCLCVCVQDAVSVTAADELSSSVSEDTGFGSAPPLPSDPSELCCDLTYTQDPHDDLDPAPPPPPVLFLSVAILVLQTFISSASSTFFY